MSGFLGVAKLKSESLWVVYRIRSGLCGSVLAVDDGVRIKDELAILVV